MKSFLFTIVFSFCFSAIAQEEKVKINIAVTPYVCTDGQNGNSVCSSPAPLPENAEVILKPNDDGKILFGSVEIKSQQEEYVFTATYHIRKLESQYCVEIFYNGEDSKRHESKTALLGRVCTSDLAHLNEITLQSPWFLRDLNIIGAILSLKRGF